MMNRGDNDESETTGEEELNERAATARKGSPFLNTAQAAHYLGISVRTLEEMRQRGEGPEPRRHGRMLRYHIADIDAWSLSGKERKPRRKRTSSDETPAK